MEEGYIQVLKREEIPWGVGGNKSSRKAVGGSEVLAEGSEKKVGKQLRTYEVSCARSGTMILEVLVHLLLLRIVAFQ